jgi:hypothetical protein
MTASFLIAAFLLDLTVALPAPYFSESTNGFGAPSIESATSIPYQQSWPTLSKTYCPESSTGQPQTSPGSTSTLSSVTITNSTTVPTPASSGDYACATVSSLVAAAAAASSSGVPRIPAQIAWDCAQSVPLNATAGRLMASRTTVCRRRRNFKTNSDRNSLGAVSGTIHKLADNDVLPEESTSWLPGTRRGRLW